MSGDIVSLISGRTYSVKQALAIIDDLRDQIANGNVIAFAAVSIGVDNRASRWTAATRVVPPLMMTGAIATLQHFYINDAEG